MATTAAAQTRAGFEAGVHLLDYSFRQRAEGELVERDVARFSGFTLGYTKTFRNAVFLRGRLAIAVGSADIKSGDGVTQLRDVGQGVGLLELHAGRDFTLNERATISPFVGLGARALTDDSGGKQTENAAGFDRRLGYSYVPIGADATFALRGKATLTRRPSTTGLSAAARSRISQTSILSFRTSTSISPGDRAMRSAR